MSDTEELEPFNFRPLDIGAAHFAKLDGAAHQLIRMTPMSSLYDRLGGEKAVNAAVELFYRHVLSDGRIARFFEGVDIDKQIAKQKSFLTMAFGGPNNYTGADMRNAHKRLAGLNDSHVDAVIENLNRTLRELGVGEKEVQEVAALANSVRSDVLNK